MEEQGHVILAEYEQGWAARAEQVQTVCVEIAQKGIQT